MGPAMRNYVRQANDGTAAEDLLIGHLAARLAYSAEPFVAESLVWGAGSPSHVSERYKNSWLHLKAGDLEHG